MWPGREPRFERAQLAEMKKTCERHCYSTLNHIVSYGYNDRRVIQWLFKQALHGFQGTRGNFENKAASAAWPRRVCGHQLGAARSRRGKTTSAHAIAIRMTDERTTMSNGATKPVRMAFALR